MTDRELVAEAIEARKKSYSPYSGYMVGAALLTEDGKVYRGCNIENAAYSPTNCAERTAFFKAVSEGEKKFSAIAVIGGHKDARPEEFGYFYPCGVCRQVMMEFCAGDFLIILGRQDGSYKTYTLSGLLPEGFGPEKL